MEQELSLQFARLSTALVVTLIISIVLIGVLFVRYRQLIKKWRAVGFIFGSARTLLTRIVPPMLIIALLGVAFSEPFLVHEETIFERNDVEVCYLFDNAGSMAASAASGEPERMSRALTIAEALSQSDAMLGVPTCIATFTAKPTLHLPATSHVPTLRSVLEDVIIVGDPPPDNSCKAGETCTSLFALADAAMRFFSSKGTEAQRVLIVFTDGETKRFNASSVLKSIQNAGVEIVFVDLWSSDEEIFDGPNCVDTPIGCIDIRYKSDLVGRETFLSFVQSSEGSYVGESESESLADVVADLIGESNPSTDNDPIAVSEERQPYAWLFILLAGLIAAVTYSEHFTGIFTMSNRKENHEGR